MHGLQPKLFLGKPAERCGSVADGDHERLVIGLVAVVERLFKADRVELALGGAYAAADAQILVDDCAAAAEAALDFLLDLLLGEVAAQILEGLECFGGRSFGSGAVSKLPIETATVFASSGL